LTSRAPRRATLRAGWRGYFDLFPDYRIEVERVAVTGDRVTLVGHSSGTLSDSGRAALRRADGSVPADDELQGPAIWTALIRDGRVAQWRVYLDTPDTRAALGIQAN
jgi:ketosteroid isomerase-like protein